MRIDHTASRIAAPHFAAIDDLTSGDTLVCDPPEGDSVAAEPLPLEGVSPWTPDVLDLPGTIVMADEEEAGEIDDFDEEDFDDEFDDDFEEELEDEYDLADLEEVSDEDLVEDDVELPIGGDFVDEDEEPEEPVLPEDPDAAPAEEEKPKGKGKAKGKGKGKAKDEDEDDEDLDLDDEE
ncbi:hypothetical protein NA78x_004817 [Anatilimnocola sp. NA78]|uniref:hypothetical protein n=1 Tax=Anatilimnocola sp. NA78 TaxID=3415683 RepID=UPI003CE5AAF1